MFGKALQGLGLRVCGLGIWGSGSNLLGGSWVGISVVIRPLIWVMTIVTLLIAPLITTHEPPSKPITEKAERHFTEDRLKLGHGAAAIEPRRIH